MTNIATTNKITIAPDVQKADIHIVRPTYLVKQRSVSAKALKAMDSVKEKAGDAMEEAKNIVGVVRPSTVNINSGNEPLIISVLEQNITSDKKSTLERVIVGKKWVEGKKAVEVPIRYEQVFVNGEELQKSGFGETLTQLKDAILKIVPIEYPKKDDEKDSLWIPLFGPDIDMEKTIPLFAEQLVISKKIVKVADIVIRKREVTETEKIESGSIREEVVIVNPSSETS